MALTTGHATRPVRVKRASHDLVPLQILADELHVHVRTLRAAAHRKRKPSPVFWLRIEGLQRRRPNALPA
jgi:hypothetical protein